MKYFIHLPMKMEPIVSSETSAIRTKTPENYPKRNNLQIESPIRFIISYGIGVSTLTYIMYLLLYFLRVNVSNTVLSDVDLANAVYLLLFFFEALVSCFLFSFGEKADVVCEVLAYCMGVTHYTRKVATECILRKKEYLYSFCSAYPCLLLSKLRAAHVLLFVLYIIYLHTLRNNHNMLCRLYKRDVICCSKTHSETNF